MGRDLDIGSFESRADFAKQRQERSTFWKVVETYLDFRQRPPLTAVNFDQYAPPTKLTFDLVDYLADVELAVRRVLEPRLYAHWQTLILGGEIPSATERVILSRCSRIFEERQLLPWDYFRSIKKGRKRPQEAVTNCSRVWP